MTRSPSPHSDSDVSDFAALAAPFLEAQRNQWDAWMRLQESIATYYKDLWEQWTVRFAGGAPLDG
jgi:hypothetical protein